MTSPRLTDLNNNQIPILLSAAVATGGTITVSYPTPSAGFPAPAPVVPATNSGGTTPPVPVVPAGTAPYTKGNYLLNNGQHVLVLNGNNYASPSQFTATFNANASGITITNKGAATWPVGATGYLQLNLSSVPRTPANFLASNNSGNLALQIRGLDLGSPVAGAANNICASQAITGTAPISALLNGTTAQTSGPFSGSAEADVPRTVSLVSSNAGDTTQVATISATDEFGQLFNETITMNGTTTVTTKKAAILIRKIAFSAALAGNLTAGFSNVLGLPLAIYKSGQLLKELQDGATATAGTLVVADQSAPTAATGDPRGTYLPNATPNANLGLLLFVVIPDPGDIGVPQYDVS